MSFELQQSLVPVSTLLHSKCVKDEKVIKPLWASVFYLEMEDGNTYWKSLCEGFWSLGLRRSLSTFVANPASWTVAALVSVLENYDPTLNLGVNLDKRVILYEPQFLSLKKTEKHIFIPWGCSIKGDNAFKVPGICQNSINIHLFSPSFSSLMPSWISSRGVWPGDEGHRGDTGSVEPHFSRLFWKWLKVKLGQESGDVWVRDRVKLRFNLSPFHVLTGCAERRVWKRFNAEFSH